MKNRIKIGLSGDKGSFSEEAAERYAEKMGIVPSFHYLMDMENVLSALENGLIERGIFPVVNLYGGLVSMAFDAMGKHAFHVIDELWLDVHQCLMIKKDVSIAAITEVVSHPQGLAQCRQYLKTHFPHAILREWQDTAHAAKALSMGDLPAECAVIAPQKSAELYGLSLFQAGIQDHTPNLTAFIIVESLKASGVET